VTIDNGELSVTVDELSSDSDWQYRGTDTLYAETYGFRDGTGPHSDAEEDGTVVSPFPNSAAPGETAAATVSIPVETADGETVDLEVVRKVTLDSDEPTLRVEYVVSNPDDSGAAFEDLRLSQYVDYDIAGISNNIGYYNYDPTRECEYIAQETTDDGAWAGFTAEEMSVGHGLTEWPDGIDSFHGDSLPLNNDDRHPDDGTGDVELTFEWSLGTLQPGESTTFRNSFVYNQNEGDFERELCQESPGGESDETTSDSQPPTVELVDATWDESANRVDAAVEFDESIASGHVALLDPEGDEVGSDRLIEALGGDHVYDAHFDLPDGATGNYTAVLDDADDEHNNEVPNPESHRDTVAVGNVTAPDQAETPANATDTPDNETTPTETATPTDTQTPADTSTPVDTPAPTTAPTTSEAGAGDGDAGGGDAGVPTTTTVEQTESAADDPTERQKPAEDPGEGAENGDGSALVPLLLVLALLAAAAVAYYATR
jgi:hypothetical protein